VTSHGFLKSTTAIMEVPASRVVTLFVDAFTANWSRYTVQLDLEDIGLVSCISFYFCTANLPAPDAHSAHP
jgi:hypothetical protein